MRKGKSKTSGPAERRRECGKGKLKADPRQIHITNRKKMDGADPNRVPLRRAQQ